MWIPSDTVLLIGAVLLLIMVFAMIAIEFLGRLMGNENPTGEFE